MRIISGTARGTKLYTLEGLTTRPTLDRVKEALFNIIQNEAKKVILCDKSKEAIQIIKKNVEKTHLKEKIELYNTDYEDLIINKLAENVDIVYIDPPYQSNFASKAVELLIKKEKIDDNTTIIIETDEEEKVMQELKKMKTEIIDKRKYGRATLIFLQYRK